ncbi:MAG: hypothetical protein J1E31_07530 [Helicobacter sp.]|nr:hypothetical protein [Helicobacter sp.]
MAFEEMLLALQDKLPKEPMAAMTLKEKFEKLDESRKQEVATQIATLNLKSPAFVFWAGNFLFGIFGVARFMIGDKVLGFVRLGLTLLVIILFIVGVVFLASDEREAFEIFCSLAGLVIFANWTVWWIVDLFLVGKKLRRQNLEKIMQILN